MTSGEISISSLLTPARAFRALRMTAEPACMRGELCPVTVMPSTVSSAAAQIVPLFPSLCWAMHCSRAHTGHGW